MTDEWRGVTRDEYITDRLLSEQDWADWRAARGWEAQHRPTHAEMVARWAADRAEVERESLEGVAERAVIHDGWATYPNDVLHPAYGGCEVCHGRLVVVVAGPDENGQYDTDDCPCQLRVDTTRYPVGLVVHATLRLTGHGDPTIDELRNQLAAIGFDCIDIEETSP